MSKYICIDWIEILYRAYLTIFLLSRIDEMNGFNKEQVYSKDNERFKYFSENLWQVSVS